MARVKIGNVFPSLNWLLARCAPVGYGLGEHSMTAVDNCDHATKNGWYLINANAANSPFRDAHGAMRVDVHTTSHIVQTAYSGAFSGRGVVIFRRVMYSGVWQEWEWENPLMVAGDEYRTTERYMGKPVYTTLVDCGAMPNATTKGVAHNLNIVIPIRCSGQYESSHTIPNTLPAEQNAVSFDKSKIYITSSSDLSNCKVYAQLWYTKE